MAAALKLATAQQRAQNGTVWQTSRGNGYVADKLWMMTKAAQLNCFIFKKTLDGTLEQQGYLVADWLTSDTTQQPRDRSHFAAILLFGEGSCSRRSNLPQSTVYTHAKPT